MRDRLHISHEENEERPGKIMTNLKPLFTFSCLETINSSMKPRDSVSSCRCGGVWLWWCVVVVVCGCGGVWL